ncbi:MAG: hypothetical protein AB7F99_14420 [Vicinamibacterales bacterium]
MRQWLAASALVFAGAIPSGAQELTTCRFLCSPGLKVEPTITFENIVGAPLTVGDDGAVSREASAAVFEVILGVDVPTRLPWLELTIEAILIPLERDAEPELEFEVNLVWLPSKRTGGWVSSHFDLVDKFSPAERPTDGSAYTHKLNLELDTSFAVFGWLEEGRWLRDVELEASLDYVGTGLPGQGDVIDARQYLEDASPWSLSVVWVLPIAPM